MPVVIVKLYEGRSVAQKAAADVIVETLKTTADHTQVIFEDVKRSDWSIAGKLQGE